MLEIITEEEAREKYFKKLGIEIAKEFEGASVKDLIDFADKLKEWALEVPLSYTGVEDYIRKEKFFINKSKE